MQSVPVNDTIDIREKFDRSGILSEVKPVQTFEFDPSSFNTRNVETVNSFDDIEGQVTELTDKQKAFIKNKQFALQENLINADDVFNTINNPDC